MKSILRKAALLIGATTLTGSALVAMPTAAFAADSGSIPPITAISVLPYCVQASDSPGRSAQLCINSIGSTTVPGYTYSEMVTASGSLTVCTNPYSCTPLPVTLNATGVGLNPYSAVPTITPGAGTTVHPSVVCYKTTCTPDTITLPSYNVSLFPPGTPALETVCVDGICSAPVLAPVVVSDAATQRLLATISAS